MLKFSHVIFYVKDLKKTIEFYEKAFDLKLNFMDESESFADLKTGNTSLAFITEKLATLNLPDGYLKNNINNKPFACEIAFMTTDVHATFSKALNAGAKEVTPIAQKPWGQLVGYVRDPEGILIEICSVMQS